MKFIPWAILAVLLTTVAAGCNSESPSSVNSSAEPTHEQIQAEKAWQTQVEEEENKRDKLGLRGKEIDPDYFKVQEEELNHRRQMAEEEKAKKEQEKAKKKSSKK
jgi:hypothetical protein